jgi:hypothetical protein
VLHGPVPDRTESRARRRDPSPRCGTQ